MPHFAILIQKNKKEVTQPHSHDYHQILIFDEGGGTHTLDGVVHPIPDNSIHFLPKGTVHCLQGCPRYYRFLFNEDYFGTCPIKENFIETLPFFKLSAKGLTLNFDQDTFMKIKNLIESIIEEYTERRNDKKRCEILQTLIHLFLLECDKKATEKGIIHPSVMPNTIVPAIVEQLVQAIEMHYKKRWKVQEYAKYLFISTSQLNRNCQTAFQKSVQDLTHERTLKEAKNLLFNTDVPLKEIAWELGFEHSSNFIGFFISKMGISPLQFRQKKGVVEM
jgi:AraC family transcriptional regulator, transcriptional activator of pobA